MANSIPFWVIWAVYQLILNICSCYTAQTPSVFSGINIMYVMYDILWPNFNGTPLVMFLKQIHLPKGSKMWTERLAHGIALAWTNIKYIWYLEYLKNSYLMLVQLYFTLFCEVDEILYTEQPWSDGLQRVVNSKHASGTILHLKFYPPQRPV